MSFRIFHLTVAPFRLLITISQQIIIRRINWINLYSFIGLKIQAVNASASTHISKLRDLFNIINSHSDTNLTSRPKVYHIHLLCSPNNGPYCPQWKKRKKYPGHLSDCHPYLVQYFNGLDIIHIFSKCDSAFLVLCGEGTNCYHAIKFFLAWKRDNKRFCL